MKDEIINIIQQEFVFPEEIIKRLQSDKDVWENYQNFSASYKRIRIAYIHGARKTILKRRDSLMKKID